MGCTTPPFRNRTICSKDKVCFPLHLWGLCVSVCGGSLDGNTHMGCTWEKSAVTYQLPIRHQAFVLWGMFEGKLAANGCYLFYVVTLLAIFLEASELHLRWFLVPSPRVSPCFRWKGMCLCSFSVHNRALWHLKYLWWSQAATWGVSE